jgi:hypothetical protein
MKTDYELNKIAGQIILYIENCAANNTRTRPTYPEKVATITEMLKEATK